MWKGVTLLFLTLLAHALANVAAHAEDGLQALEAPAHILRPFRTNGCSAPFKLTRQDWTDCCSTHDFAYWVCGDQAAKRRADTELVNCLRQTGVSGAIAGKIFEWAPSRLSDSHWCARWSNSRKSGPLSEAELKQVSQYIESFGLKFPITEKGSERDCLPDELPESIQGLKGLICFDLVKLNPQQINQDKLVYSDECIGYFVVRNKVSAEGFGQCAKFTAGTPSELLPNCYFSPPPMMKYLEIIGQVEGILTFRNTEF